MLYVLIVKLEERGSQKTNWCALLLLLFLVVVL